MAYEPGDLLVEPETDIKWLVLEGPKVNNPGLGLEYRMLFTDLSPDGDIEGIWWDAKTVEADVLLAKGVKVEVFLALYGEKPRKSMEF